MKKTLLLTATAMLVVLGAVSAQDYRGNFVLPTDEGDITLRLDQTEAGVTGEMVLGGETYPVQGSLDELGIFGSVFTGQQDLYFEAELQGDTLYMIMALVDPVTGQPDPESAGEYVFVRAQAPAAAPGKLQAPPAGTAASSAPPAQGTAGVQPAGLSVARIGQRYEAGGRVGSPDAGVSFIIPEGYYAGYHPGQNAFVLISDTSPGLVAVSALSVIELEDALRELGQSFSAGELMMQPQGTPQVSGNVARARFTAFAPQGQLALYIMGVAGSSGNVLTMAGLGTAAESAQVEQLVEAIAASAILSPPSKADASDASGRLAGLRLSIASSDSSTGITGGAYSSTSRWLDLCSAGNYEYQYQYRFSADVPGVAASDSETRRDSGRWQVESGLLGPVVVLRSAQDGSVTYLPLLEEAGALYVDGAAVTTQASPNCG